jgi:hypothetical protein
MSVQEWLGDGPVGDRKVELTRVYRTALSSVRLDRPLAGVGLVPPTHGVA